MGYKTIFTESTVAKYVRVIRATPRELICNARLLLSVALYACSGIPLSRSRSIDCISL